MAGAAPKSLLFLERHLKRAPLALLGLVQSAALALKLERLHRLATLKLLPVFSLTFLHLRQKRFVSFRVLKLVELASGQLDAGYPGQESGKPPWAVLVSLQADGPGLLEIGAALLGALVQMLRILLPAIDLVPLQALSDLSFQFLAAPGLMLLEQINPVSPGL